MSFYEVIKNLHSGFRYIVFVFVLLAIVLSWTGWLNKKPYTETNRRINLFALISVHTQLLIGIILMFLSPLVQFSGAAMKNNTTRYFTIEHWVMMVVAVVLVTIGHSKSKKIILPEEKHKAVAIFYSIAFLVIVVAILAGHIPFIGARQ